MICFTGYSEITARGERATYVDAMRQALGEVAELVVVTRRRAARSRAAPG